MRKSSATTRLLGMPVVPPVSNTYHGLSLNPLGIQRVTGPPRSQSSSKNGNLLMSSHPFTSLSGLKVKDLAFSSQNGVPVSGLKCQRTTSRTWASSWVLAFLMRSSRVAPVTGAGLPGVSFTAAPRIEAGESVPTAGGGPGGRRIPDYRASAGPRHVLRLPPDGQPVHERRPALVGGLDHRHEVRP